MHWSAPADNGSQSHYSRAVGVVGAHRVGTLRSVAVLSREEFDAIEFDAAFSGEHRSAAQRMTTLARTGTQTEAMPRAEAFLRAGEQWLLADDPAGAARRFPVPVPAGRGFPAGWRAVAARGRPGCRGQSFPDGDVGRRLSIR